MKIKNAEFYQIIKHKKIAISTEQLEELFARAEKEGVQLASLLVKEGILNVDTAQQLIAEALGYNFISLEKRDIADDVLQLIPEQIAKKSRVIAFDKQGQVLHVAMQNPDDLQVIDFLHKKTGLTIAPYSASEDDLQRALRSYKKSLEAEFSELISEEEIDAEQDLASAADDVPIVRVVDAVLEHAILDGASDIHIEPLEKYVVVRYRIDGILRDAMQLPRTVIHGLVARVKVLANLKLDEHRLPQDGRFKIEKEGYKISFRVSILPVFDGEKIVMRLLDESGQGLTLEKMGMSGESLEVLQREMRKPNGMILVTGPTGSGKTTTLYTVLDILNTAGVNISTIEDPVEYRMDRINQTQVHAKIGMTFAAGLRALLRQDPDIIMVGEIRDHETLEIAVHAAMTGHLVLSTLHTNSAAGAISRMIDMGMESFLLASTVNVIIAQRLVRRLCIECRQAYRLTTEQISGLQKNFDMDEIWRTLTAHGLAPQGATGWTEVTLHHTGGCAQCNGSGYKGRQGIFEVFEVTPEIELAITQNATADQLTNQARQAGMVTMAEDGFAKVLAGETTIEEVIRVTKE